MQIFSLYKMNDRRNSSTMPGIPNTPATRLVIMFTGIPAKPKEARSVFKSISTINPTKELIKSFIIISIGFLKSFAAAKTAAVPSKNPKKLKTSYPFILF